mmetsp:Transcript_15419/g.15611  ORF Transcript_15419/g.15611 Transcript_15419/m.15611 type:complete len:157 (+) Transcript_15419:944-1414(+)
MDVVWIAESWKSSCKFFVFSPMFTLLAQLPIFVSGQSSPPKDSEEEDDDDDDENFREGMQFSWTLSKMSVCDFEEGNDDGVGQDILFSELRLSSGVTTVTLPTHFTFPAGVEHLLVTGLEAGKLLLILSFLMLLLLIANDDDANDNSMPSGNKQRF